jgi:hypothetical protein
MLLGLLWIKPQYAILVLPALLMWRNWRSAEAFAGASFALLVVSWLTIGADGLAAYARLLSNIESTGSFYGAFPAVYNTLSGLLVRFVGESGLLWLVLAGLIVFAALWYARRGFGPGSYAFLILATVLVSLHTHSYDLVILLPAAALGWEALKQRPSLALAWAAMWFILEVAMFALAVGGTQFHDTPLVTVPTMLLAVAFLLIPKVVRPAALVPARV